MKPTRFIGKELFFYFTLHRSSLYQFSAQQTKKHNRTPSNRDMLPAIGDMLPAIGDILPAMGDILPAMGDILPPYLNNGNIKPGSDNNESASHFQAG
jgi:hypothetical protein